MNNTHVAIGTVVKERREALGMKQYELAGKIGWPPSRLCLLERGTVMPRPRMVLRLANALGVTVRELIGRDPEFDWVEEMAERWGEGA